MPKRMTVPFLAVLALAVLPAGAVAAEDCMATASTQMDMNVCAGQAYHAADEALAAEYKRALESLGDDDAPLLRDAQRAWINFRDKACKAQGSRYEGGSIQPMVVSDCLTRLTEQRTEGLRLLSLPE